MKKEQLKSLIKEVMDEMVTLNPERQEEMTKTQLVGLHHKAEKMLDILESENVNLEPWMIDKISVAYHAIDTVANKMMFGGKKD